MNSLKQNVSPSPKSPAGRFFAVIGKTLRILAKLLGVLLVLLILTFLVFHFIVWPKHDRERFAEAEQIVEERIVSLGVRAEDMQRVHECLHSGQKYIPGKPFCNFEYSFVYGLGHSSSTKVFNKFGGNNPDEDWYFSLKKQGLNCLLEAPYTGGKFGPPGLYTVRCSNGVARYIYN